MSDTITKHPPPAFPGPRSRDVRDGPLPVLVVLVALLVLGLYASWWAVAVVVCIGIMIFLHELGHYVTARWGGMKVTEFFLGFGPRLWSYRRGETTYGLKAIPFGAYVKIIGMHNLEEVPAEDEPRTYRQATYPRRLAVGVAGSTMHFLQALVILLVIYMGFGVSDHHRFTVDEVVAGSAAEQAGLQAGDRPLAVDGTALTNWDDLATLLESKGGQPVTLTYARGAETHTAEVVAGERLNKAGAAAIDGKGGLRARDRILAVDGQPVSGYSQFLTIAAIGGTYAIDVPRGQSVCTIDVTVRALPPAAVATTGFLGLSPTFAKSRLNPLSATGRSFGDFGRVTGGAATGIARFFTPSNVGGFVSDSFKASSDETTCRVLTEDDDNRIISIVGVGNLATEAGRNGVDDFLELFALFNIFIGVFNLLPLLPFDGGHVVVATYERIRSRRGRRYFADVTRMLPITYAVTIVMVMLGVLAIYRDILQPPSLGG
ncbi:MAG TPA: RIP metalloprotease RseP [Acidimicrobiales bacterium]|nr:RIP metalloprotease RseP [Acidimicrobiales bacterium]